MYPENPIFERMTMKTYKTLLTGFFSLAIAAGNTLAATIDTASTPEEKGLAIAIAADKNDEGWGGLECQCGDGAEEPAGTDQFP